MARYGKGAQEKVHKVMKEYKKGELHSGKSGKKVKSRKQAIAIGLSEARKRGAKVPAAPKSSRSKSSSSSSSRRSSSSGSSSSSRSSSGRSSSRRSAS